MEAHAGMDEGYSSDEDSWYAAKVQMPDGSKKVRHSDALGGEGGSRQSCRQEGHGAGMEEWGM
jgi:hypothetical protein